MHATRSNRTLPRLARTILLLMVTAFILSALQAFVPPTAFAEANPVDQLPPITTALAPTGWQNRDVLVTLSATDAESGVAFTYWTLDNGPTRQGTSVLISSEGVHSLSFWSEDRAGNREPVQTATIRIDKMAPIMRGSASTIEWTNQPVLVTFTCQDALSGLQFCQPPITITTEGMNQTVTGDAVDNAGNRTNAMVSGIKIDRTAPTMTATTDRAANGAGWYNAPIHLSFTCTDTLSGVRSCQGPISLSTEGADQSVVGTGSDRAGNEATLAVTGLNLDFTSPTITGVTDRAANLFGWFNAPVTISFRCDDALSGVATCAESTTLNEEGANQSVTGEALDLADNRASRSISGINIDLTPPALAYAGNAGRYTLDEQINITCEASDDLSGIASTTCQSITGPAYSLGFGTHSFAATVTDKAGNVSAASTSFDVVADFESLCSLGQRFVSKVGIGRALCAKLDAAKAAADQGHMTSKAAQISSYITLVEAQTGKALTVEQAGILIQLALTL